MLKIIAVAFGFLFVLSLILLFLASLVLPWINFSYIRELRDETKRLKSQIKRILAQLEKDGVTLPPDVAALPGSSLPSGQQPLPASGTMSSVPAVPGQQNKPVGLPGSTNSQPENSGQQTAANTKEPAKTPKWASLEQQFGANLPVWIGGAALALAGFFLVKYSIEAGLLSPVVRVVLGMMFGTGLLSAASWIRARPDFDNRIRIGQALCGAGIAVLYASIFAASSLYALVPDFAGFAGMAAVTAIAVVLSLRHGMPIALLGLVGGFLTPALVGSQSPNAPVLFIYLYFVLAGLMVLIRKQGWWFMSIPAVLGAYVWVCMWLYVGSFNPPDTLYLGLFMIAVTATAVASSNQQYDKDSTSITDLFKITSVLNYLSLGGAILLTGSLSARAGFGLMEWSLFGLLSLGGIALAFYNQKLYGLVPWVSMAVTGAMLLAWNHPDPKAFALTISIFGLTYIASGYRLQSRSERPLIWAGLTSAASICYYLIAYFELRTAVFLSGIPLFWGFLALAFSGLASYALKEIMRDVSDDHPQKQHLMAVYAATGTAFLSAAFTIELPGDFLAIAIAGQLLAISWLNTKLDVRALRQIAVALACVFGLLLAPQISQLTQMHLISLFLVKLPLPSSLAIVNSPALQLGLPALLFTMASYFLRRQKDDTLVRSLEVSAVVLIGMMAFYLIRHAFHSVGEVMYAKVEFVERGTLTNMLFVFGLACLWTGRHFLREAVGHSGVALCGLAVLRICYFDIALNNPLWMRESVGDLPVFNALLLVYGLPAWWTWIAARELAFMGRREWSRYGYGFIMLLCFILISLNVRQFFHGTYLNDANTSNAEIYTYSAAWILFGISLLCLGTLRNDKMIRIASLAIMLLTVGKVFLYDASELEGLYRVFSLFGLGVSLMGLSWFYTRYVFGKHRLMGGTAT